MKMMRYNGLVLRTRNAENRKILALHIFFETKL